MEEITSSPKMGETKQQEANEMRFLAALRIALTGKTVTKKEWDNEEFYITMRNGRLQLHKDDGKWYDWIISDGDTEGEDWIIINK